MLRHVLSWVFAGAVLTAVLVVVVVGTGPLTLGSTVLTKGDGLHNPYLDEAI
jgi:hypothetical protein